LLEFSFASADKHSDDRGVNPAQFCS